jgi:hypothetical protein
MSNSILKNLIRIVLNFELSWSLSHECWPVFPPEAYIQGDVKDPLEDGDTEYKLMEEPELTDEDEEAVLHHVHL